MNYWVAQSGQKQGPFPLADLRKMIAEGRVAMTDLAWTEGMATWAPLSQVLPAEAPPQFAPPPSAPAPQFAPPQQQPVQQQYVAPAPAYSQPGYVAPVSAGRGPVPPDLHWLVVLLLVMFTFGIFGVVWIFKEASFVKQIDPRNNSRELFILVFIAEVVLVVLSIGSALASGGGVVNTTLARIVGLLGLLAWPAISIIAIVAIFKMRRSLINYYNSTENIGLRLSGVMTFFFSIYYFQYHFSRIAAWKRTGQLVPQQ